MQKLNEPDTVLVMVPRNYKLYSMQTLDYRQENGEDTTLYSKPELDSASF